MTADSASWKAQGTWKKVLTVVLACAIVVVLVAIVYVLQQPAAGARYTDFYVLGLAGNADRYPAALSAGEEGRVILGIANNEGEAITYRLEVTLNGTPVRSIDSIVLDDAGKWEQEVGFTPDKAGANQEVRFLLYRAAETETYRSLLLKVDVR